jgi:flagellar protein FliL
MAETAVPPEAVPKKRGRGVLFIGLALALLLGGAGFYATYTGMIFGAAEDSAGAAEDGIGALPDIAFVPLDPLIISLGNGGKSQHLRFTAQLEVASGHEKEVELLKPRILDVLNGYLRAVEVAQLEDPTALIRLRAQMLRRLQIVTGEGRVRDLLITEFVLN